MKKIFILVFLLMFPISVSAQNFYATPGGGGDMSTAVYDPAGGAAQVAFATDLPEPSTAAGQLLFGDGSGGWDHSEITEMLWDDTAKTLGIISAANPQLSLGYDGTENATFQTDSLGTLDLTTTGSGLRVFHNQAAGDPTYGLEVSNAGGAISYINVTSTATGTGTNNGLLLGYNNGALVYNRENTNLTLAANNNPALTITPTAFSGFGTATPRTTVDALGTIRNTYTDDTIYSQWATDASGIANMTATGGSFTFPAIKLNDSTPAHTAGMLFYDDDNLNFYNSESDVTLQIGQEMWVNVRNISGADITDGSVVYIDSNDSGLPTIELANSGTMATACGTIGVATHTIENGTNGWITRSGTVRGISTAGYTAGDLIYLSNVDGEFTDTVPDSPNYIVQIGNVGVVDASDGTIIVEIAKQGNTQDVINVFNGSILESHMIDTYVTTGVAYLSLEKTGGGDLHLFFDGDFTDFPSTPAEEVALTAGSDTAPTLNYVYIPKSTTTLTASTAGWPSEQHVPVATVLAQSVASFDTYGAYKVHAWTDHLGSADGQGHVSHVNYWIRQQNATWMSGAAITPTGGASTFDIATSSATVLQLHPHDYPAFNTATGSDIYVVNNLATPYARVGDLAGQDLDSAGVALTNKYYSVVIWGVVSEDAADCKLMANLPSDSYFSSDPAIEDANKYTNYTIPAAFKGTGFLIARLTVRNQSDTTYTIVDTEDLRGQVPQSGAGGASPAVTTFPDSQFNVYNVTDNTKVAAFSSATIATGTTRTFTFPNASGTIALTAGPTRIIDKSMSVNDPEAINTPSPFWYCDPVMYPSGVTLTRVAIQIPADGVYSVEFEEWTGDPPAVGTTIETVATGASDNYASVSGGDIDDSSIAAGNWIFLELPATDIDWMTAMFYFYIN
jgi:hypothetical protein